MTQLDPDTDLMLRFQRGEDGAFEKLVLGHQGRVVSLAYRYLGSAADAEDVAQEVFLRVYRAREKYQPTAKFSTWLHRVTVNASLNALRGRRVRRKVSGAMPAPVAANEAAPDFEDPEAESPGAELDRQELAQVLRRIIERLPERQRTAILLNKYQGLSYEETAGAMEMSLPAVKSLLTRARVNIKDKLLPYLGSGRASAG